MIFKSPASAPVPEATPIPNATDIKQNVEGYLRAHISTLSPVKAVLGGTWYVVSVTTDVTTNSGTVVYEDGHIQETKNFSYTTNAHGDVTSVTLAGNTADNTANTSGKSGITGTVLLGPTCPVMRDPPDPQCADKPYQTTVQVFYKNSGSASPFASLQTNKAGQFSFSLPPGEYILKALGGNTLPRCADQDVTVRPNIMVSANISCDTGIR